MADEPQMENEDERRNWAEIGGDILLVVFRMVGVIDVLMSAELVCRSWRKAAKDEPELWRRIHMTKCDRSSEVKKLKDLTSLAIDRSKGRLEELWIYYFCDEDLLQYACGSTHVLKSLRLIECYGIDPSDIVEAVIKQPLLEELEIILGHLDDNYLVSVGEALPNLKQFRLNHICSYTSCEEEFNNVIAIGIAKTMQQLLHLQLVGNKLTNKGLTAILEGCRHLESLDIRMCNNVKMNSDMRTRCNKLTTFRPPGDSLDDYPYQGESRCDFHLDKYFVDDDDYFDV